MELAGWPLLRCDALRLLASCHRGASGGWAAQQLAGCLLPLLGIDSVGEAERVGLRAELLALVAAAATPEDLEVAIESATLRDLISVPLSAAQEASSVPGPGGGMTVRVGKLLMTCATPDALSAEAAAEAVALAAATGRRLSIGQAAPPAAALLQAPPAPSDQLVRGKSTSH